MEGTVYGFSLMDENAPKRIEECGGGSRYHHHKFVKVFVRVFLRLGNGSDAPQAILSPPVIEPD